MRPPNEPLQITVRDSVYDPDSSEQRIQVREASSDYPLYRVFLYLEGPDLPFVNQVTYTLHPTFDPRDRPVLRSLANTSCKLEIWTWGLFDVTVEIEDRRGFRFQLQHPLSYADELQKAPPEHFETIGQ